MPGRDFLKDKAKKGGDKARKYEACLMRKSNYDKIVDHLAAEEYEEVIKIFERCKVPIEHQDDLLKFAIDCFNMRYCQW